MYLRVCYPEHNIWNNKSMLITINRQSFREWLTTAFVRYRENSKFVTHMRDQILLLIIGLHKTIFNYKSYIAFQIRITYVPDNNSISAASNHLLVWIFPAKLSFMVSKHRRVYQIELRHLQRKHKAIKTNKRTKHGFELRGKNHGPQNFYQ